MISPSRFPAYRFEAAVIADSSDQVADLPSGAHRVKLHTVTGIHPAITWLAPGSFRPTDRFVALGRMYACDVAAGADEPVLVLTGLDPLFGSSALAHVPATACPSPGEVDAIRKLVSDVSNSALRSFLEEAFSDVDAFQWFWTCPASLRNHHAEAGGLARHSRHVAEQAALAVKEDPMQRDFAIAYALLHDYGKVWSYEEGHLTELANRLGHEQIGYERLLPGLIRLRHVWPDGGVVMQSLLSNQWKRDGKAPIQAVGNVVRAMDQFSAESDMNRRQDKSVRWRPVLV